MVKCLLMDLSEHPARANLSLPAATISFISSIPGSIFCLSPLELTEESMGFSQVLADFERERGKVSSQALGTGIWCRKPQQEPFGMAERCFTWEMGERQAESC